MKNQHPNESPCPQNDPAYGFNKIIQQRVYKETGCLREQVITLRKDIEIIAVHLSLLTTYIDKYQSKI